MIKFCSQKYWQSSKSLISKLWIYKPFVVHHTTVRGAHHKPMLNGDLCDHGIVEQMMWLLGYIFGIKSTLFSISQDKFVLYFMSMCNYVCWREGKMLQSLFIPTQNKP